MEKKSVTTGVDIPPVIAKKIIDNTVYFVVCNIIGRLVYKLLDTSVAVMFVALALSCLFLWQAIRVFKKFKNGEITVLECVCTNKRHDISQFGFFKTYEFEPVNKGVHDKVITLDISNDDTGGITRKKLQIREGYTYNLYFFNKGDNTFNTSNYIGFERSVYDGEELTE